MAKRIINNKSYKLVYSSEPRTAVVLTAIKETNKRLPKRKRISSDLDRFEENLKKAIQDYRKNSNIA